MISTNLFPQFTSVAKNYNNSVFWINITSRVPKHYLDQTCLRVVISTKEHKYKNSVKNSNSVVKDYSSIVYVL
jgi:hypothetical protein